jgi:hypothetical protein
VCSELALKVQIATASVPGALHQVIQKTISYGTTNGDPLMEKLAYMLLNGSLNKLLSELFILLKHDQPIFFIYL